MRIFNRKKVNETVLKKMKDLRSQNLSYDKISKEVNLHISTVMYHLNENYREKLKEINRKKGRGRKKTPEEKAYNKEYQKERYTNDPQFRERQKKRSRDYQRKRRENG